MWSGRGIEPFAFTVWKINTFSQRQGRQCCWSRLICLFGNQGSAAVFCTQTWILCWALLCLAASPDCSLTWLPVPRPRSLSLYCSLCCLLHLFPSTFLSFLFFLISFLHHNREVIVECLGCLRSCQNTHRAPGSHLIQKENFTQSWCIVVLHPSGTK